MSWQPPSHFAGRHGQSAGGGRRNGERSPPPPAEPGTILKGIGPWPGMFRRDRGKRPKPPDADITKGYPPRPPVHPSAWPPAPPPQPPNWERAESYPPRPPEPPEFSEEQIDDVAAFHRDMMEAAGLPCPPCKYPDDCACDAAYADGRAAGMDGSAAPGSYLQRLAALRSEFSGFGNALVRALGILAVLSWLERRLRR